MFSAGRAATVTPNALTAAERSDRRVGDGSSDAIGSFLVDSNFLQELESIEDAAGLSRVEDNGIEQVMTTSTNDHVDKPGDVVYVSSPFNRYITIE